VADPGGSLCAADPLCFLSLYKTVNKPCRISPCSGRLDPRTSYAGALPLDPNGDFHPPDSLTNPPPLQNPGSAPVLVPVLVQLLHFVVHFNRGYVAAIEQSAILSVTSSTLTRPCCVAEFSRRQSPLSLCLIRVAQGRTHGRYTRNLYRKLLCSR